jgi:hypothetical protein
MIWVFATCSAAVYNVFDWFKEDVTFMIDNERYGHLGWYNRIAKMFRYGENISESYTYDGGSFSESSIYPEELTADELAEANVVKHAFAMENSGSIGVALKVASIDGDTVTQLTSNQLSAFTGYINRVKPAGIPVRIINEPAERLKLVLKIWVNPLVLDLQGNRINGGGNPVETAINQYLNSIEFAGEFVVMRLIDFIQRVEGVSVVSFISASSIVGGVETAITGRHTPNSGYMKLDETEGLTITYISE